jgi:hypothetical protein
VTGTTVTLLHSGRLARVSPGRCERREGFEGQERTTGKPWAVGQAAREGGRLDCLLVETW